MLANQDLILDSHVVRTFSGPWLPLGVFSVVRTLIALGEVAHPCQESQLQKDYPSQPRDQGVSRVVY